MDYWDRLGWKDPFATKEFTERQSRYKVARKQKQMWTPQFVVDNEIVANTETGAIPTQVASASKATSPVSIVASATVADGKVAVSIRVAAAEKEWKPAKGVAIVPVLFQRHTVTDVRKGENEGRKLEEFYVVIAVAKSPDLTAAMTEKGAAATFDLPKGLKAADVGIAVLVEDSADARTLQAIAVDVAEPAAKPGAKPR